jgi:hypothetical protein
MLGEAGEEWFEHLGILHHVTVLLHEMLHTLCREYRHMVQDCLHEMLHTLCTKKK